MPRPSALLLLAALTGGCSPAPPPPPAPPQAVTLRVQGERVELPPARVWSVRLQPDLEALVVQAGEGGRALHLVLLGPDWEYRRPPELPADAEGDSWLRLDARWLEAAQVHAEVDRSQPGLLQLHLRGTFLDEGRPVPVEGELAVRVRPGR